MEFSAEKRELLSAILKIENPALIKELLESIQGKIPVSTYSPGEFESMEIELGLAQLNKGERIPLEEV